MIPANGGAVITLGSGFLHPDGVAVDAAGNVYVADTGDNAVKEILAGTNTVITLGSGFLVPEGVAVDGNGNVFVTDNGHNQVVELPAGGGMATVASGFNNIHEIAVDGADNIYVSDAGAKQVYAVFSGSTSLTPIGSGMVTPIGICLDNAGRVFVADFSNSDVVTILPSGGYYLSRFLPPGLTFNSQTGAISGRPTKASPATVYDVIGYNSGNSASAAINITVNAVSISYNKPKNLHQKYSHQSTNASKQRRGSDRV